MEFFVSRGLEVPEDSILAVEAIDTLDEEQKSDLIALVKN